MVVLTNGKTQKNGKTIFLDQAIPQVYFTKLISCSLYNSWDTLKNEGTLSIVESDNSVKVSEIPPGYYTLESVAKQMEESLKKHIYEISADTYSPLGQLVITNHGRKTLRFDQNLSNIFGISGDFKKNSKVIVQQIKQMAYFIHCDLIDRNNNFFNNKKSDLLAKIDVKGRPYEKVRYDASAQQPIRDYSTSPHVNSITISVRDENGQLFYFKDMPLESTDSRKTGSCMQAKLNSPRGKFETTWRASKKGKNKLSSLLRTFLAPVLVQNT